MLIGGLWHGASMTFILWGGLHGLLLVLEKLYMVIRRRFQPEYNIVNRSKGLVGFLRVFFTFHIFIFLWILFRSGTMENTLIFIGNIGNNFSLDVFAQWISGYWGVALLMAIGLTTHFLPSRMSDWSQQKITAMPLIGQALLIVIVIFIVIQVKSADVQPFIYFQF